MAVLQASHIQYTAGSFRLRDISLEMEEGTVNLLMGPSGSGKTTLMRLLAGLLPADSGRIVMGCRAAMVPQRPEELLLKWPTPRAYLLSLLDGMSADAAHRRLGETAGYFSLGPILDRPTQELSGGQIQLIAAAGALMSGAELLLLDEPTAQLDPIAAADFIGLLDRICRELNITVLLSEHRIEEVFPAADRVFVLDGGALAASGGPREAAQALIEKQHPMVHALPAPLRLWAKLRTGRCTLTAAEGRALLAGMGLEPREAQSPAPLPKSRQPVLALRRAWFRYTKDGPDVLQELSLHLASGEILTVLGGNGAGKSTMLDCLAGKRRPYSGKCTGSGFLIPQNPRPLFGDESIGSRLDASDPRLDQLELSSLLNRHTDCLSCGEVQRAAAAFALQSSERVILMDEPTRGMDPLSRDRFAALLRREAEGGRSFLIVSHDVEFCAAVSHRCALLFSGRIIAEGVPQDFFSGNLAYTTGANRMARHWLPNVVTTEGLLESL